LIVKDRDEDPLAIKGENDEIQSTEFTTYDADLNIDVAASKDMGLYMILDLDDAWNEATDQDDLLEECYFYWKNIAGSTWQANFGKKEVPFGQDKRVGFFYGYVHGQYTGRTSLFRATEADVNDPEMDNAHDDVGAPAYWAGEVDNVFQVEAIYSYKDLAKLSMAVFQDRTRTGGGAMTRGMHEDRSDDTMFFQSYATKLEVMPVEGLTMELSFLTQHVDSYEDEDIAFRPVGAIDGNCADGEEDTHALSFGVDYKFKGLPVEIFGEYVHQWDWAWDDRGDADIFQLGLIWGVTENIDLGIMGDYCNIDLSDDDDAPVGLYDDQEIGRAHV
jgi:hypothetical protein